MELRPLSHLAPLRRTVETKAPSSSAFPQPAALPVLPEPAESFSGALTSSPSPSQPAPSVATAASTTSSVAPLSWQEGNTTYSSLANGPIVALEAASSEPALSAGAPQPGLTLAELLSGLTTPSQVSAQAMQERENVYLGRFPFKNDEAAVETREALAARYNDPSTSSVSVKETVNAYAASRGVEVDTVPEHLHNAPLAGNLDRVRQATAGVIDKLFLSSSASFNPEKHATVSQQTERFLELAAQAAPQGFSASDAYRLVAGNLALVSYQDNAAAENMLGDHGVRHLLGHNINACEQLADGLEQRGTPVSAVDRLVLHQAMIVHDLGYAMDSVRDPINDEGLKGQDAGHNALAARYLRERSQDPDDPLCQLFAAGDLERMHRCVLFHDKDQDGGPGVNFRLGAQPSEDDRACNLETITRVADNSHAFEDKLPELLYRKPESLKTMRLMKTAGELGDPQLLESLKADLATTVANDPTLAKDDREALLQSVSSVTAKSYQFSVGRISGSRPTFGITEDGKVELTVSESDTHQQTSALFGMPGYKQMEKFIKDCSGQKVSLNGQSMQIEGDDVRVIVNGSKVAESDPFNAELHRGLLEDKAFVRYAHADGQLSDWQGQLEQRQKLGEEGLEAEIAEVKKTRRQALQGYRASSGVA